VIQEGWHQFMRSGMYRLDRYQMSQLRFDHSLEFPTNSFGAEFIVRRNVTTSTLRYLSKEYDHVNCSCFLKFQVS
jgi:hypothetical protein